MIPPTVWIEWLHSTSYVRNNEKTKLKSPNHSQLSNFTNQNISHSYEKLNFHRKSHLWFWVRLICIFRQFCTDFRLGNQLHRALYGKGVWKAQIDTLSYRKNAHWTWVKTFSRTFTCRWRQIVAIIVHSRAVFRENYIADDEDENHVEWKILAV